MTNSVNIADRLRRSALQWPSQRAVVCPTGRDRAGRVTYAQLTFRELDETSDRLAAGFRRMGVTAGSRMVLMVRPSIEFMALTFALFKVGAVVVLIDPGMGRSNIFRCLEEVEPDGFVAIPIVHWIRTLSGKFPRARWNVRVGSWWAPGCVTSYRGLMGDATPLTAGSSNHSPVDQSRIESPVTSTLPTDPAAIIFTSGSTGPPKGVLYEHGMFNAQVDMLQTYYRIEPGEIDLPGFPLFGLFNAAMGVTTVIPDMDPTKPAQVDPRKIVETIQDHGVTQAFGSPAFWNRVGTDCVKRQIKLPSLRRALSAGGPVPIRVLEMMTHVLTGPSADLHTPYGATESLPVASIGAGEVLSRTANQTRQGAGTCVGKAFPSVEIRIIPATAGAITSMDQTRSLPPGEIGEIIIRSPAVTRSYFRRTDQTSLAKISDGDTFWHRIGDVGYFDDQDRLWFCGRKAHIVHTANGPMYSVCCEGIFDAHPHVYRSALVGIGEVGAQIPVLIVEPMPGRTSNESLCDEVVAMATQSPLTQFITQVLLIDAMPVDTRHNVKIHRESLAVWAKEQLKR